MKGEPLRGSPPPPHFNTPYVRRGWTPPTPPLLHTWGERVGGEKLSPSISILTFKTLWKWMEKVFASQKHIIFGMLLDSL